MDFFNISNLLVIILSLIIIFLLFTFGGKRIHKILGLFNFSILIWATFALLFQHIPNKIIIWKVALCGVAFSTSFYYHFILDFFNIKRRKVLYFSYFCATFFCVIIFTAVNFSYPYLRFNSIYYPSTRDPLFIIFFLFWFSIGFYAFLVFYNRLKQSEGKLLQQGRYIFIGSIFAFISGIPDFLTGFNFNLYPYFNILIVFHSSIFSYAILRKNLLDIHLILHKSFVYSLLVAVITAVYFIFVLLAENIFKGVIGYRSFFISVISAFVIALFFSPLKSLVQKIADRFFLGKSPEQIADENELLKQELFRSEKLKAVAQFASGMAHEIKNPLTALKTFTEYLPQKKNDQQFLDSFSSIVGREVERIDGLVRELLDFSKPSPAEFKELDIHKVIDETLDFLTNQCLKYKILVEKNYQAKSPVISGDPQKLKQVFLNLFMNAIEAMQNGGKLSVITDEAQQAGDMLIVTISDTGCGIPEKDLPHIFEPFYTTKEKGSGLGLSIVYNIIKEHCGNIIVNSIVGQGTEFVITLPYN